MFVMTMTKKKLLRAVMLILVLLTGIAIGIFAILSAVNTQAYGKKVPIYCVDRADNKISLTFDVAWGNSNTDELIAILKEADVKATFFVTGEWCDKYSEDVAKFYKEGHEIANHSDAHPHVNGMNINELIEDTKECNRKIKMITGSEPTLYRTPYGEYDDTNMSTLEGMGMKVIQWSNDSIDWDNPSPETIISRTTQNINSGAILLFHNDLENTTNALPTVIKTLKSQGFEFELVSKLIYEENYTVDAQGKQVLNKDVQSGVVYSNNKVVNGAMEVLSQNLSVEEVDSLSNGMTVEMYNKIKPMLTQAQLDEIQKLSYDELKQVFIALSQAVNQRDLTGDETTDELGGTGVTTDIPDVTTFDPKGENTAVTSVTTEETTAETTADITIETTAETTANTTAETTELIK